MDFEQEVVDNNNMLRNEESRSDSEDGNGRASDFQLESPLMNSDGDEIE